MSYQKFLQCWVIFLIWCSLRTITICPVVCLVVNKIMLTLDTCYNIIKMSLLTANLVRYCVMFFCKGSTITCFSTNWLLGCQGESSLNFFPFSCLSSNYIDSTRWTMLSTLQQSWERLQSWHLFSLKCQPKSCMGYSKQLWTKSLAYSLGAEVGI